MCDNKTETLPVMGHLATNFPGMNEKTPAVIVNPAATANDLFAWCWGEMESLRSTGFALAQGREAIEVGDFSAIIMQRLTPLADVFDIAMDKLITERGEGSKNGTD